MPDNDAIIKTALELYKIGSESDKKERAEAMDDLKFEHNEDNYQWPKDIYNQRQGDANPRPCLSLNKIPEKIDKVDGEFRQLRPSFKVRGVDNQSDTKVASIFAGILRHIEYNSNARSVYNFSHNSVLRCGRGAWSVDVVGSKDDPFVRDIEINRIANVMSVVVDPDAQKQDKSDANWIFLVNDYSKAQFEKKFPGVDLSPWPVDLDTYEAGWRTDTMVRVAKYWWKEEENRTFYRVKRPVNGVPQEMTVKEDMLQDGDEITDQKTIKYPVVKWCRMTHDQIIEGPHDWPSRYIPIIYQVGRETNIDGQNKTRGMVRHAKTPQQLYNFWSSSITEQIALSPKAPYLATAKMIGKYQAMWDAAAVKNYMYLLYEADPNVQGGRPAREMPPQLSPAISHELQRMSHDIMAAMGIFESSLGAEGPEVSGKAILAKQKQGSLGSYTFTDNFQVAYVYSLKVIIDLIPYVYDTERIIRIRGEDDKETAIPINATPNSPIMQGQQFQEEYISGAEEGVTEYINDMTVGKYDVTVTIGPAYDTQRQEVLAVLMELVGAIPQFGPATVDLIIQYIDIPKVHDELIKRAKKIVPVDIRGLEPGEEPPEAPGPTPAEHYLLKELELKGLTEMRKAFEGKLAGIAKLITAEAKERGNQIQEISKFVEELRKRDELHLNTNPTPGSPVPGPSGPGPALPLDPIRGTGQAPGAGGLQPGGGSQP